VIATHTMKTADAPHPLSSLSHPACAASLPLFCTPSLALAAAQRSY